MHKSSFIILVFWLSVVFVSPPAYSQSYAQQQNEVIIYNLLLNGIIGGVGGAMNKQKQEKWLVVFGKNFLKGALGGGVKYMAKYEAYYIDQENTLWSKPNRLLYYLGQSFVINASLNRELWHSYYCQFWGAYTQFQFKEGFKVNSRVSVMSIYSLIEFAVWKNKFNLHKSLEYGLFYFDLNTVTFPDARGIARMDAIAIIDYSQFKSQIFGPKWTTTSHEIIHTYQYSDYFPLSNIFDKYLFKVKENKFYAIASKYIYFDIPYQWLFYELQPKSYYNFYEFEAQHFATRKYIDR